MSSGSWIAELPPLRDYSLSRAVVMGTWEYAFLGSVPAAETSLRRMAELLAGRLCGWPQDRLLVVANERGPGDLPDRLVTAFDGVRDAALFYYVGHGQISADDQLCLGLGQSRPEPNRRAATSLRFSDVRQALLDSGAAVKIVILDCCFAGLATTATLAGLVGDVLDLTAGTGAYTMAATSAYATAWYEDDPGLVRPQTYFTKYLADLVEQGIPGQSSRLRLDALFTQLRENLAADGRPLPSRRAVNDAREFAFAYNAAPLHTHRDHGRELANLTQPQVPPAAIPLRTRGLRPKLAHVFGDQSYGVESMAWQPHGELLATGNGDSSVTVFNTSAGREEQQLYQHDYSPGPDGRRLRWDDPCDNWVYWSPDGRYLASWPGNGCGGNPSVWDSRTRTTQVFKMFHADEEWNLVAWRRDGPMREEERERADSRIVYLRRFWGSGTVKLISEGPRWSLAWLDLEQTFLLGGVRGRYGQWDDREDVRLPILDGGPGKVRSLAWSSDGMRFAVYGVFNSDRHRRIEIWEVA